MERTVPRTSTEEVDLYIRTVYSLLRSTTEVQIRSLEEVHQGINSVLHVNSRSEAPDPSAFIYSQLRLPDCMPEVKTVVMGQDIDQFIKAGYQNAKDWDPVTAKARRRRWLYGNGILACYVASRSDIDDVVPVVTAYQIEWNKLHSLLARVSDETIEDASEGEIDASTMLADELSISLDDLERFRAIWVDEFADNLKSIRARQCNLSVRLLGGTHSHYERATRSWFEHIERSCPELRNRPIYFVSSNTHSLANLLSGFALQMEPELIDYLKKSNFGGLKAEWQEIQAGKPGSNRENFLYYLLKRYQGRSQDGCANRRQEEFEQLHGITRICSEHYFDVDAQVINLARINSELIDPRLSRTDAQVLSRSDALILNIDYPLGLAAYNILSKVSETAFPILGIYIMGKAATLNGRLGDVMISNVIHDEHSQNTYLFQNAFSAASVTPYLTQGTVLDNQKVLCVLGTFLQNAQYMSVFYREGFSVLEMESGPYMSAIYELSRPKRHPINEIVNLYEAPFDVGLLHYASDTPMSKGRNLGAGTLSYFGMDSTYAASIAILRRIVKLEAQRLAV